MAKMIKYYIEIQKAGVKLVTQTMTVKTKHNYYDGTRSSFLQKTGTTHTKMSVLSDSNKNADGH
ncbi:hypothetical protein ABEY61_12580 [Bacillus toyonensis]|uniref:hypothetical protein n=1 Tax=Bacillus toyonensis TaxID=155322 RepID=UPI003D23D29F